MISLNYQLYVELAGIYLIAGMCGGLTWTLFKKPPGYGLLKAARNYKCNVVGGGLVAAFLTPTIPFFIEANLPILIAIAFLLGCYWREIGLKLSWESFEQIPKRIAKFIRRIADAFDGNQT